MLAAKKKANLGPAAQILCAIYDYFVAPASYFLVAAAARTAGVFERGGGIRRQTADNLEKGPLIQGD